MADSHHYFGVQLNHARFVSTRHFEHVGKHHAFAASVDFFASRIVQTQHDVLRRNDTRIAVGRQQHVVRSQHQRASFGLRLKRQRNVNSHLVTVEVGVKCSTNKRMQLDRFAFDQDGLESLNAKTMQGRCAVEQHRMFTNNFFE